MSTGEFFHYTSKKAFDVIISEPARWVPSFALGRDAAYGPGWYVTLLPPETSDDLLLRALWNGDLTQKHKTEFWLRILVTETYKGFKRPDSMRPDLLFIPFYNRGMQGDPPKPTGWMSRVLLLEGGRRSETESGQVTVRKLFEPNSEFPLVENRIAIEEGYPLLARYRLGFHDPADYPNLEEFEIEMVDESDALFKAGEFAKALTIVDRLLVAVPKSVLGLSNKGAILAQQRKREQALALYDQALQIDPVHVSTLINKAGNLVKLGRASDALAVCDKALSLDPCNATALNNKGIALANCGQDDQAYVCFERATQLMPQLAESWNGLASILGNRAMQNLRNINDPSKLQCALSDIKASAGSFLKALEMRPTYETARQNLRSAIHDILALLPRTYACEPEILKAAVIEPEIASELCGKLFRGHVIGLHPKYLAEVEAKGLYVELQDQRKLASLIYGVLRVASEQESEKLTAAIAEPRLRLGFYCVSEALIHFGLMQFSASVAMRLESLPLTFGERLQTAKSLGEIGVAFRKVGEWDSALRCYEKALFLYEQCGDQKFRGHMLYNRGVVWANRMEPGDLGRAHQTLTAALQIYRNLQMHEDEAATCQLLSELANS